MTPLEILRRSFKPITIPRRGEVTSGVYLLIDNDEIVYCGASKTRVFCRVAGHMHSTEFDDAIWYPLPPEDVFDYEGALTRFLEPRLNDNTPHYRGLDNEILERFGLPVHADPEAIARKWHLKRYAKTMRPWPAERKESARRERALSARRKESIQ